MTGSKKTVSGGVKRACCRRSIIGRTGCKAATCGLSLIEKRVGPRSVKSVRQFSTTTAQFMNKQSLCVIVRESRQFGQQYLYGGLFAFDQWTDNLEHALAAPCLADAADWVNLLPKKTQAECLIGDVVVVSGARVLLKVRKVALAYHAPSAPFLSQIRWVATRLARDAAEELGLEIDPGEPVHVRYPGPLADYRADWLFKAVSFGGHESQVQVHVEAEAGVSSQLIFRSPNCKAFRRLEIGRYLAYWKSNQAGRIRAAGDAWAGLNGRDTGKGWHLRSGDCGCDDCRAFRADVHARANSASG